MGASESPRLAQAWPEPSRIYSGNEKQILKQYFPWQHHCSLLEICFYRRFVFAIAMSDTIFFLSFFLGHKVIALFEEGGQNFKSDCCAIFINNSISKTEQCARGIAKAQLFSSLRAFGFSPVGMPIAWLPTDVFFVFRRFQTYFPGI